MKDSVIILGKVLKKGILRHSLTTFFGVGLTTASRILDLLNISTERRVGELLPEEIDSLTLFLRDRITVEADLRNHIKQSCLALVKKGCYRGKRHVAKLPVRGQRTSTNARTNKRLGRRYVL